MTANQFDRLINDDETLNEIKERIERLYKSPSYAYFGVESYCVGSAQKGNWVKKEIIAFGDFLPPVTIQKIKNRITEHSYPQ
jgi:hypothetical protein